ncbi:hypothetical protein Poli38472_012815 [Pythium oligandrum]|uniref:Abnormal spindle-like microcephaly-associated protein ASH domain-containing protein n=1 Tax=Pythium oligandrum TaxID=41045 RepID=A0A8K1CKT9_PYTOL|nr:hypothetical protein Poli38472_012815 [Pythium oligandrum]|eukprot:TMW64193.1 hypothetical protein Poli38472_012815 [Pythium oligandrum]
MSAGQRTEGAGIPVLNRVEQQRNFGIDCGDAIHFEAGTWLPGGEHVKKIAVKNVSKRSIKFKYELPTTKYFSMDFPTLSTLSPGMQIVLDVAFRPVKLEEYDDFVTFHVQIIEGGVVASSGKFRLPVIARIASISVELPRGLDFGFCPTAETTEREFVLRNTGQIDVSYEWTIPGAGEHGQPFAVLPPSGRVDVGESIKLVATFLPSTASVFVTTTLCSARPLSSEAFAKTQLVEETMKISGISKFTHISASEREITFGDVLVGAPNTSRAPTEKEFVLRNRSLVRASFHILRIDNDCDPVFFFSPTNGVVDAESSVTLCVRFTPLSAGTFTCDRFKIITPGGNQELITCRGRGVGPVVSVWKKDLKANFARTRSVNFRDVAIGKTTSRVLTLRNESPIEVFFHVDCQDRGVFLFDKVNGKIAPFLDLNVTVTFTPTRTGNYHRRFFILVQNQSAIYVDILATAYDDSVRPSPFQQAHVDAYRQRATKGLGLLNPDQLETYLQENGDDLFLQGALKRARATLNGKPDSANGEEDDEVMPLPLPSINQLLTRSGEMALADVECCEEYFVSVEDKSNAIVVHGASLDFGNCSIVQFPSKKVLHVTNNTHGKVTCTWRVSSVGSRAPAGRTIPDSGVFQVFPDVQDIGAGATAEFRVAFQPSEENTYYFAELEGFASFKSNRTFRLVNIETFTPPWCVVTKAWGNTFDSPTEQFLPKVSFRLVKPKRVLFPPCYLGDHVFQTIMMENASDTPAFFMFLDDPSEIFMCKPQCGYIPAKSFHLVQLRFAPRRAKTYTHALQCIVNNARSSPEIIDLTGICALPQLVFQDEFDDGSTNAVSSRRDNSTARIFVKPTAIGLQSTRTVCIQNAARVPLVYRWEIPRAYEEVFDVTPKLGRLNGKESMTVACRFTPNEIRDYVSRFIVAVRPISIALSSRQQHHGAKIPVLQEASVRVQSKGTIGAVVFEPDRMNFDTILVNTSSKQNFFIVNTADCDLMFTLSHTVRGRIATATSAMGIGGVDELVELDTGAARLEFSEEHGCISSRSRRKITATFLPRVAGAFEFEVCCMISLPTNDSQAAALSPKKAGASLPWRCGVSPSYVQRCVVTAEASFPTVVIEDIRVPHRPTSSTWHQFYCQEINEYLSAPLTRDEVAAGDPPSTSRLVTSEEEGSVPTKHFAVPFSPAPLGSRSEQIFIKLKNPGSLIVEFSLRYPKEGNVEIEHWAETGAPSSEELRMSAIIDSKIFGIAPRYATLMPHQSIILALSYSYGSDSYGGVHDLPILLQVEKGKRLVLELQGRTLPPNEPRLFLPRRVFHLSPVMIGEYRRGFRTIRSHKQRRRSEDYWDDERDATAHLHGHSHPPVQQIEVFNCGESASRLEVSSNAFAKINNDSYGFPVLRCITTSEIIPAKSSIFIDIEFSPIEAKTIEANLILKAHGLMGRAYKEAAMVTIIATAYHPGETSLQALRREYALAEAPRQQLIPVPQQSARFVSDFVDFGHVAAFSQKTKLLVLQNDASAVGPIRFEWQQTAAFVSCGALQFSPSRGILAPGDQQLIRVTVDTTSGDMLVVDHDLACVISEVSAEESETTGSRTATMPASSPSKISMSRGAASSDINQAKKQTRRTSVIARSTATQDAAIPKVVGTPMSPKTSGRNAPKRDGNQINSLTNVESASSTPYPLFAHIYAHVVPREAFERLYPHEVLEQQPPPIFTASHTADAKRPGSKPPSASSGRPNQCNQPSSDGPTAEEDALRQTVVMDVMETLFSDVLGSDAVQAAMEEQLRPPQRADKVSDVANRVYPRARQSEDCQAILTSVMENTVFNILQELFYGDIEQELLCVPRKAVLPINPSAVEPATPQEIW